MLILGVQKSLFDGKLSIGIQANDIFHTMKFKETEYIKNIHFQQIEDYCLWNYSLSVIYRLNQKKPSIAEKLLYNKKLIDCDNFPFYHLHDTM